MAAFSDAARTIPLSPPGSSCSVCAALGSLDGEARSEAEAAFNAVQAKTGGWSDRRIADTLVALGFVDLNFQRVGHHRRNHRG